MITSDHTDIVKMSRFSIFLVILLTISSEIKCETEKIVGGDIINISDAPYQAALLYSGNFICGASIISKNFLLTAAHCVHEYRDRLSVRVGSNNALIGGEILRVEKATKHPLFNINTINYDFAILKLAGEITLQPGVKEIIKLPLQNDKIENNIDTYVSGYGLIQMSGQNDFKLRSVVVPIVPPNICRNSYPFTITNQMICAGFAQGGKDSCQGDSGGPMVRISDKTLIGVVSFGNGCALPRYFGVYAKVSVARLWIKNLTKI